MSEIDAEARREVSTGIASVSRLMESLGTRENNSSVGASLSNHLEDGSMAEVRNHSNVEASGESSSHHNNSPAACSANSHSS
ncbi:hypothetical protein SESBI_35583 [Sesbania bispinosa]|nr:hypothetical protein SESBI_35583 [Sesbania bispinosa]